MLVLNRTCVAWVIACNAVACIRYITSGEVHKWSRCRRRLVFQYYAYVDVAAIVVGPVRSYASFMLKHCFSPERINAFL